MLFSETLTMVHLASPFWIFFFEENQRRLPSHVYVQSKAVSCSFFSSIYIFVARPTKPVHYSSINLIITMTETEATKLINNQMAAAAAIGGANFVNESADKIKKARADGPLTFRMLGFLGGLAMVFSNGIAILDRLFSFNYSGFVIAVYGVFFGIMITSLEAPGPCSRFLTSGIRYYCKFLEYTWGRGLLYFFCGTLQVSNWNILDWAVGGFMIFVGVTACGVGIAAARDLRLVKFAIKNEAQLKAAWDAHDLDKNGKLDVKELTAFVNDTGVDMTRNEIAAAFLALDKNFDDKITYEELYFWWNATGSLQDDKAYSV